MLSGPALGVREKPGNQPCTWLPDRHRLGSGAPRREGNPGRVGTARGGGCSRGAGEPTLCLLSKGYHQAGLNLATGSSARKGGWSQVTLGQQRGPWIPSPQHLLKGLAPSTPIPSKPSSLLNAAFLPSKAGKPRRSGPQMGKEKRSLPRPRVGLRAGSHHVPKTSQIYPSSGLLTLPPTSRGAGLGRGVPSSGAGPHVPGWGGTSALTSHSPAGAGSSERGTLSWLWLHSTQVSQERFCGRPSASRPPPPAQPRLGERNWCTQGLVCPPQLPALPAARACGTA